MRFDFDESQVLLQRTSRHLLQTELATEAVRALGATPEGMSWRLWQRGAEMGWIGSSIGDPQPLVTLVAVAEELGRALAPGPFLPTNIVIDALEAAGSHAGVSSALRSGDQVAAWCLAEPGIGWAPGAVALSAKPTAGGWELHGAKTLVQDAHIAEWLLVAARGPSGLVQLLVPRQTNGVHISVSTTIDPGRRLCDVGFRKAFVGHGALVGGVEDAASEIIRLFLTAIVLLAGETVGLAARVLDMTTTYATQRVQFGRPIGSFQAIKHKCADMLVALETARAITHLAAMRLADGSSDAEFAVRAAKSVVFEQVSWLCSEAIQVHGGIGMTWHHDLHLYLRRARLNEVLYGDVAAHRECLAAMLGM